MAELGLHQKVLKLMGNRFEITVLSEDEAVANENIQSAITEIQRIEQLLTTFNSSSVTEKINQSAGLAPVEVPEEVFALIARSISISKLTQGAFDITYGSMDKRFWNFDLTMTSLPSKHIAKKSVKLIDYRNVILNENDKTVFLKHPGMRIGFGGIGKGYAAERAKIILQDKGIKSGIVNAAGDLTLWGQQANGKAWTVGIADPSQKETFFSSLKLNNTSIATSGNYEKFVVIDGKRYSHTIDPKTGYPVSGIKSVTVITPNAELADAMTTPLMVMGLEAGLDLINQMKQIACILVDDNDKIFCSNNINIKV